jgi:uncharacterized integral membrane protein
MDRRRSASTTVPPDRGPVASSPRATDGPRGATTPEGGPDRDKRLHHRPEREFVGTGWFWSLIIGSLIALAVVVFVLQNSHTVAVKFLGWEGDLSLAGVVLVVALGAMVADELFGTVYRRRRRRRLNERARLTSAQHQNG